MFKLKIDDKFVLEYRWNDIILLHYYINKDEHFVFLEIRKDYIKIKDREVRKKMIELEDCNVIIKYIINILKEYNSGRKENLERIYNELTELFVNLNRKTYNYDFLGN